MASPNLQLLLFIECLNLSQSKHIHTTITNTSNPAIVTVTFVESASKLNTGIDNGAIKSPHIAISTKGIGFQKQVFKVKLLRLCLLVTVKPNYRFD